MFSIPGVYVPSHYAMHHLAIPFVEDTIEEPSPLETLVDVCSRARGHLRT